MERIIWASGLIDGEGWIGLSSGQWGDSLSIKVVNTEKEMLEELQDIFKGGSIHPRKRYNNSHKQAWVWSVYGNNAWWVLGHIHPFLLSPNKQTKIQYIIEQMC